MKKTNKPAELLAALVEGAISKEEFIQGMMEPESVSAVCWEVLPDRDAEPSPEAQTQVNYIGGKYNGQQETITWAEYQALKVKFPGTVFHPPITFCDMGE